MRGQRWFVSAWEHPAYHAPMATHLPRCSYLRTFLGWATRPIHGWEMLPATPLRVLEVHVRAAFGYRRVYMTPLGKHHPIASQRRVLALRENAFFPPPSQPALTYPK